MFYFFLGLVAFAFGAGLTNAQSAQFPMSVSTNCQSVLMNLVSSPDAACLDLSALLSLAINSKDTSIVGTINNWATGVCSTVPCTNATIAAVVTNITTGCSAELTQMTGLASFSVPQVIQDAQMAYPTVRKIVCLENTSTNQLCITETLTNFQNLLGTLSVNNAQNVVSEIQSIGTLPTNITCTDCIKEAYNVLQADYPGLVSLSGLTPALQVQCGSDFTNGEEPSEVQQFINLSKSSGGLALSASLSRNGMAVFTLVVMSAVIEALS